MEIVKRALGYHKTPPVLVQSCLYELDCVLRNTIPTTGRRLFKRFWQMKNFLFGKGDDEPTLEECEALAEQIISTRLVLRVLMGFSELNNDERNSFVQIFCTLLARNHFQFATKYMISEEGQDILTCIVKYYGYPDIAIHSGIMLRECIKIRCIHEVLMNQQYLIKPLLTVYVYDKHFDVSTNVLLSIRELVRRNKQVVAITLHPSTSLYKEFFTWYNALLQSSNYVILRLSLRTLSEVLMDKLFFALTSYYVADVANLRIAMNLLLSPYPSIQLEAFNVFKVFVANRGKSEAVYRALLINKSKLLSFLVTFLPNNDDSSFYEEKHVIISMINSIK